MDKDEFTDLAWNDHRAALLHLFDQQQQLKAEQDATQQTVMEVAAAVHTPADEPAAA